MIASLGMYDMPPCNHANDALWMRIRLALGHGPDFLDRTTDLWTIWQSPDLLFSQTCGYPFRAHLHEKVQLIATPNYALPDCAPGYYRSVLIARTDSLIKHPDDLQKACFAYNDPLSQSGWAGPMTFLQDNNIVPARVSETGSHAGSINAVLEGRADFAGIDLLTWILLSRRDPDLAGHIQILDHTPQTPGLPYVTSLTQDARVLQAAVRDAIENLSQSTRDVLHLHGLVDIPAETYLAIPTPPPPDAFQSAT